MPRHACRIATVAHLGSDSPGLRIATQILACAAQPARCQVWLTAGSIQATVVRLCGCETEELQSVGRLQQRSRCQLCERATQTYWQPLVDLANYVIVNAGVLSLRAGGRFCVAAQGQRRLTAAPALAAVDHGAQLL